MSGARRRVTLAVLCVTLLLISLDNTILNVALPSIVRGLQATSTQLQWVVDSFAVCFAGLLLTFGALGDRLGRKWVFMAGLIVFGCGSACAAWSGTPDRLTAARALMGVGAAALMPSTLSILTNVFTAERDRARAIGIWSGTAGLGVAIGPMLGGLLLVHFWWGSVFLINVPIAAVGLVATALFVPNSKSPHPRRADTLGAVLSVTGVSLLLWAIIEAPGRTWSSPLIVGALAASIVVLTCFVLWERSTRHPMLPLEFFKNHRYSAAIVSLALLLFALLGLFFLLTQYLQFALGFSPLKTGLAIGPIALVVLVAAPTSVVIARWFGTKPVVAGGLLLVAAGLGLLSRTTVHSSYAAAVPSIALDRSRGGSRACSIRRVDHGISADIGCRGGLSDERHLHAAGRRTGRRCARHSPQHALSGLHGTVAGASTDPAEYRKARSRVTRWCPGRCRPCPRKNRNGSG